MNCIGNLDWQAGFFLAIKSNSTVRKKHGKMSPVLMFREPYIKTQRELGVCRNWFTKEAWADVRKAFSSLSDAEKQSWKTAADAQNLSVQNSRNRTKKWLAVDADSVGGDPAASSSTTVSTAERNVAIPKPPILNAFLSFHDSNCLKHQTSCVGDFLYHLADRFSSAGATSGQVDPCPIGESNILSTLLSLRLRKIKLRDVMQVLSRTCEATAGAKSEHDIFPEKVTYAQHCQGICGTLNVDLIRCQSKIVESLNAMVVAKYKRPSDLVRDDLVLSFEMTISNKEVTQEFYLVTATAFQGGIQKPIQSYIKLHTKHTFKEDCLLELIPEAHVPSIRGKPWPSPVQRAYESSYGCCGAIESLSTIQLAAHLVEIAGEEANRMSITIRKCLYKDVSRSVLQFTGFAPDWQPLDLLKDVPVNKRRKQNQEENAASLGPSFASASSSSSAKAAGGFDMLIDFVSEDTTEQHWQNILHKLQFNQRLTQV